jgi:hypothetical protein
MSDSAIGRLGREALPGWRGAVVDRVVARPVSRRTRFDADQIRAAIGLALVLYTAYRLSVALLRSIREARDGA